MKVLLVCAGGLSTSILMKKLIKYADANSIELEIDATGINDFAEVVSRYDAVLVGPQIGYRKDEIATMSGKPVAVISPTDYGIGNAENVFAQISKLLSEGK